ncbi:alanine racemase [Acidithiobacillus sp. IBUN Pt1247-S3]|uniref:alanine racemase n=1 Tax=Acidithiobacillus sp. IBUN Pt1247-S3 TaxID=3166642 RepID=UPI0034E5953F
MSRPNQVEISASALAHNLAVARQAAPKARVMGAIKANAYGHGAPLVATTLAAAGIDAFAVASVEEAEELRGLQLEPRYTALAGPFSAAEIPLAAAHGHRLVLQNFAQLQWLQKSHWQETLEVFVKFDSGMHRLGFAHNELAQVFSQLRSKLGGPLRVLGLLSHLARADTPEDPYNAEQIDAFQKACGTFGIHTAGEHSLPNSAAILALPQAVTPWIRPGLLLYGLAPLQGRSAAELDLQSVLRWRTEIVAIRTLRAGDWLGYGASWQSDRDCRVGVIACGYGDGLDRRLGLQQAPVLVRGQPSHLLGRVSMDLAFVALDGISAEPGDPVQILGGPELPLEDCAQRLDTIAYEIGTRIAQRVPRIRVP